MERPDLEIIFLFQKGTLAYIHWSSLGLWKGVEHSSNLLKQCFMYKYYAEWFLLKEIFWGPPIDLWWKCKKFSASSSSSLPWSVELNSFHHISTTLRKSWRLILKLCIFLSFKFWPQNQRRNSFLSAISIFWMSNVETAIFITLKRSSKLNEVCSM